MFDLTKVCHALGAEGDPEAPHQFAIGELGFLVLEEDCHAARLVLNARLAPHEIIKITHTEDAYDLPVFLSKSPGDRICYHMVTDTTNDQTATLMGTLEKLIANLNTKDG